MAHATFFGENKDYNDMTFEEIFDEINGYCGIDGDHTITSNKNTVNEELKKFDINQMRMKNFIKKWPSCRIDGRCKIILKDHSGVGDFHIYYNHHSLDGIYPKCGIKIIGMKPNYKKDGGYSNNYGWFGLTVKQLKQQCRDNGIKGYSKLKKLGLIKKLLAI